MNTLKFSSPHSIVDSSFFQRLSELKLNEYKLDTSAKPLMGSFNFASLRRDQDSLLELNDTSFLGQEEYRDNCNAASNFISEGQLYNVNTIEEFKNVNKAQFLKDQGARIYDAILNNSFVKNPATLNQFAVLSFSDLKKYKFYYWVAFPQLHSKWDLISTEETDSHADLACREGASKLGQCFILDDKTGRGEPLTKLFDYQKDEVLCLGFYATSTTMSSESWELRNLLTAISIQGFKRVKLIIIETTPTSTRRVLHLECSNAPIVDGEMPKVTGWERTSDGKLGPKVADLGKLIDPRQLADEAVNLNLKLMKWRISPSIDLDVVKNSKCLLLGSGTLGSYVARALLAWGVDNITLVDNGKVSFSNPVRQPLFTFDDCLKGGSPKAEAAANALKQIYPSVNSKGYDLEVPMAGHPIYDEAKQRKDYDKLISLIEEHDVIFLLMDSRETRWLPTVVCNAKKKLVINAALGFDSYLVMRHGCVKDFDDIDEARQGCYFCNDVFAPSDSLTDRTLDQMCTVTRPGVALVASGLAVELMTSVLQHPDGIYAPTSVDSKDDNATILGAVPHQIRGFLHSFNNIKLDAPNYKYCSACSLAVIKGFQEGGWEFVKHVLNDSKYLEELTGLAEVQRKAEEIDLDFDLSDDDDDSEGIS